MTRYQTGSAFRRAMEDHLRSASLTTGLPLVRLRKLVAFDRYLARLIHDHPDQWLLKGGFAIELRLAGRARTTKDIDVLILGSGVNVLDVLRKAGSVELDDWFEFEIRPANNEGIEEKNNFRYHVRSLLDSRTFEEFHIDVGVDDPVIDPIDFVKGPALLEFAGIEQTTIPCYPITQQIAEKLHAYTRPRASGESSRVKDFVDILLLAEFGEINPAQLLRAFQATFETRQTHHLPVEIPNPPVAWLRSYSNLAAQVGLRYRTLDQAAEAVKQFLNPLLRGETNSRWNPDHWSWG